MWELKHVCPVDGGALLANPGDNLTAFRHDGPMLGRRPQIRVDSERILSSPRFVPGFSIFGRRRCSLVQSWGEARTQKSAAAATATFGRTSINIGHIGPKSGKSERFGPKSAKVDGIRPRDNLSLARSRPTSANTCLAPASMGCGDPRGCGDPKRCGHALGTFGGTSWKGVA